MTRPRPRPAGPNRRPTGSSLARRCRWLQAARAATVTYTPALAYGGTYEVLAWVAPTATQSSAVSVTIRHAQGESVALLDETAGEVGWHSLGTVHVHRGRGRPCDYSQPRAAARWWPMPSNG